MNHEIYVFGSIIRGDVDQNSDVDILVIPLDYSGRQHYPQWWSVYSKETIESYFREGRLFAWHLYLEARCIFSQRKDNFISQLGEPAAYSSYLDDIDDLLAILKEALYEIKNRTPSVIYELGLVHTALRDIAMSSSAILLGRPTFSKYAPLELPIPFPLARETYTALLRARQQSTRGVHADIDAQFVSNEVLSSPLVAWVEEVRSRL